MKWLSNLWNRYKSKPKETSLDKSIKTKETLTQKESLEEWAQIHGLSYEQMNPKFRHKYTPISFGDISEWNTSHVSNMSNMFLTREEKVDKLICKK